MEARFRGNLHKFDEEEFFNRLGHFLPLNSSIVQWQLFGRLLPTATPWCKRELFVGKQAVAWWKFQWRDRQITAQSGQSIRYYRACFSDDSHADRQQNAILTDSESVVSFFIERPCLIKPRRCH